MSRRETLMASRGDISSVVQQLISVMPGRDKVDPIPLLTPCEPSRSEVDGVEWRRCICLGSQYKTEIPNMETCCLCRCLIRWFRSGRWILLSSTQHFIGAKKAADQEQDKLIATWPSNPKRNKMNMLRLLYFEKPKLVIRTGFGLSVVWKN